MSVDAAVQRIQNNLKQNVLDWDVTESELKNNTQTLKDLSPAERSQAIEKLSDAQLQHWANETKGANSPLSADDRRDLLNMFAKDLKPEQLARVTQAFGTQDMAQAVASHGSSQQKQAFIENLQSQASDALQVKPGLGTTTSTHGNESARAIAQVLGSLKDDPQAFAQAAQGLQETGKLDDVMKAAAGQTTMTINGSAMPTVSFDDQNLQNILSGATGVPADDMATRTAVFAAAAPQLAAMQGATGSLVDAGGYNASAAQRTADAMGKVLTRQQAVDAGLVSTPAMPPGASMDQNIRDAQARRFPQDMGWFYNQVRNQGPWDYKQQDAQYQDFGNFNYGLTAAAMGIPQEVALRGAGWAQERAGTSEKNWGSPWLPVGGGSYGDDPADQQQIKDGYAYYNAGLWRIWND